MGSKKYQWGFTLMELIGVMAVMAILASALAPNLIDSIDRSYAEAEDQNLKTLVESLHNYILANKQIPTATTTSWVTAIATQSQFNSKMIEFNKKQYRRRLIFDPKFFTNSDSNFPGLTQNQGLVNIPVSPRALLVSDFTRDVPTVSNTSTTFNSIWNQTSSSPLLENSNLKIERINLASIFHRMVLTNQHTNQPFFQLEAGDLIAIPAESAGLDGILTRYVISNTQLKLFKDPFPSGGRTQTTLIKSSVSLRYQNDGINWNWVTQ